MPIAIKPVRWILAGETGYWKAYCGRRATQESLYHDRIALPTSARAHTVWEPNWTQSNCTITAHRKVKFADGPLATDRHLHKHGPVRQYCIHVFWSGRAGLLKRKVNEHWCQLNYWTLQLLLLSYVTTVHRAAFVWTTQLTPWLTHSYLFIHPESSASSWRNTTDLELCSKYVFLPTYSSESACLVNQLIVQALGVLQVCK